MSNQPLNVLRAEKFLTDTLFLVTSNIHRDAFPDQPDLPTLDELLEDIDGVQQFLIQEGSTHEDRHWEPCQ